MLGVKTIKHTVLALSLVLAIFAVGVSPTVSADGNGSPDTCLGATPGVMGSQGGTDNGGSQDAVTVDVGAGKIVTGVCIKSGENMFNGNKHSAVLGNGTYEEECYTVAGVGTQIVTVTRAYDGKYCQGISHIDVVVGQQPDQPDDEDDEEPVPNEEDEDESNGQVLGAATQVTEPPVGGVGAGAGSTGIAALSIVGLVGSLGALSYGVVQLRKNK